MFFACKVYIGALGYVGAGSQAWQAKKGQNLLTL